MNPLVYDASAILAVIFDESGADAVMEYLAAAGGEISAVNGSEVGAKLAERDWGRRRSCRNWQYSDWISSPLMQPKPTPQPGFGLRPEVLDCRWAIAVVWRWPVCIALGSSRRTRLGRRSPVSTLSQCGNIESSLPLTTEKGLR